MPQPFGPGSNRQPPQAPFDLWRASSPSAGRPRSPLLWAFVLVALVAVFASGFWFRAPAPPLKPGAPEAKPDDLVKEVLPKFPYEPSPEEEKMSRDGAIIFGGAPPLPHAGRSPALDPETAAKAAAAERRRRQLEAKSAQRQALAAGVKAREALDRWKSELLRWDALSAKLLDGEEGRPIAGGPEYVRQFRAVFQAERPSRGEYEQLRDSVEKAVGPIEAAAASPDDLLQPSQVTLGSFAFQASRATLAATAWKEAIQEMNALALLARRRGLSGKTTLRQAIEDLETEMAAERLKAKDARLAEAEKKAAEADAATAAAKVEGPAERRLAAAKDDAELRRQGDLRVGTFWKGVVTSYGAPIEATMKITARNKDEISGSVSTAAGAGLVDFVGKVKGTSVKLREANGGTRRIDWVYHPATKSISGTVSTEGGMQMGTHQFRLVGETAE